jgi:hypothetical protein
VREVVINEDGRIVARFVQVLNPGKTGPALVWKDTGEGEEKPEDLDETYDTEELIDQLVAVLM